MSDYDSDQGSNHGGSGSEPEVNVTYFVVMYIIFVISHFCFLQEDLNPQYRKRGSSRSVSRSRSPSGSEAEENNQ